MKKYKIGGIVEKDKILSPTKFWASVAIIGTIVAIVFLIYAYLDSRDSTATVGKTVTASFESDKVTHETPYFTFQTDKYWALDEKASTGTVYYYRKTVKGDYRASLKIAVNTAQSIVDRSSPYMIPLTQVPENLSLSIGEISPNCSTLTPESAKSQRQEIKFADAVFYCTPDNVSPTTVMALVGGTDQMKLVRPSGDTATYFIRFDSTSFDGSASEALPIMETFKVR